MLIHKKSVGAEHGEHYRLNTIDGDVNIVSMLTLAFSSRQHCAKE